MEDWTAWVSIAGVIGGCGIVSVALALAGEPQSAWLWCDVIGLEVCR
jgi:hypothetical protein